MNKKIKIKKCLEMQENELEERWAMFEFVFRYMQRAARQHRADS